MKLFEALEIVMVERYHDGVLHVHFESNSDPDVLTVTAVIPESASGKYDDVVEAIAKYGIDDAPMTPGNDEG